MNCSKCGKRVENSAGLCYCQYIHTPPANTGWICPKCGIVNSPAVLQCPCNPVSLPPIQL